MKRVLIFGVGSTGRRIYSEVKGTVQVVGFLDNDKAKWGCDIDGVPILGNAGAHGKAAFDEVIVASLTGYDIMQEQLVEAGVPAAKINRTFVATQVNARLNFLRDYAAMRPQSAIPVAEGGVFQGEFAKEINACFPDSPIYLFDTFEGFDSRDIKTERENGYSIEKEKHLNITSEDLVLGKLPHSDKAVIRKGYFPDTAAGLENIQFQFVNLDFDLYNPILEGLRFFYPRTIGGGVILVHDYFNPGYKGVAQAVAEYEREHGRLVKIPIGDHCSLCIIKE